MPEVLNTNVEFLSIVLTNPTTNTSIDLISESNKKNSYASFDTVVFNEDINEPSLSGSLVLVDSSNFIDTLNLKGANSRVKFVINFYDQQGITNKKELAFNILDIKVLNDMADQKVSSGSGTPNKILIRFASRSYIYTNFVAGFDEDFIGIVSNDHDNVADPFGSEETPKSESISSNCVEKELEVYPGSVKKYPFIEPGYGTTKPKSFISKMVSFFNADRITTNPKPLNSDASFTTVWLKPLNYYYPKFKNSKSAFITNLINYVKENTVVYDATSMVDYPPFKTAKKPFVDFMFWEDLDSYNFKSIAKIASKYEEETTKPIVYYINPSTTDMGSILSMEIIKDIEAVSLLKDGVYASEYVHVKPNWASPYRSYLDTGEQLVKTLVRYNYATDVLNSKGIDGKKPEGMPVIARAYDAPKKGYPLFNSIELGIVETPTKFDTRSFAITDLNYGYFDTTTHNSNIDSPWWNFLTEETFGFTYNQYYDNYKLEPKKYPGISGGTTLSYDFYHYSRYENEHWQAQFDMCDLPGSVLYQIQKNIKEDKDLLKNRKEYGRLKKLKEKWRIYKEQVCCERKIPTSFYALITDAEKIYGGQSKDILVGGTATDLVKFKKDPSGIYAYNWTEVEFWPRADVTSILANGEEIVKFADHGLYPFVFVKPRGGLQGRGITEKVYKPAQQDEADPNYKPQGDGITGLNRSVNVGKKYWTKDTRAFNINEILNTAGMTLTKADKASGLFESLITTLEKCKSIISNPGITSRIPGENTGCGSSYPKDFSMMPVGRFKVLSPCGQKYEWKFGRIVQMHVLPKEIMATMTKQQDEEWSSTGITYDSSVKRSPFGGTSKELTKTVQLEGKDRTLVERGKMLTDFSSEQQTISGKQYKKYGVSEYINQSPYLFVFDVENAHDGLCDGTC